MKKLSVVQSVIFWKKLIKRPFLASYILHFAICDVIMNIVSYIFLIWNQKLNRKYYHDNRRVSNHTYSLGERYQISENIRVFKVRDLSIDKTEVLISVLHPLCIHFDVFYNCMHIKCYFFIFCYPQCSTPLEIYFQSQLYFVSIFIFSALKFDFRLTIFGPFFFLQMSDSWQNELHEILSKVLKYNF